MNGQADGAIIVDTDVDASGFEKGSAQLRQATERLSKSVAQANAKLQSAVAGYGKALASGNLKDMQRFSDELKQAKTAAAQFALELTKFKDTKFQTDEYKEIQGNIDAAQKSLDRLMERQAKMDATNVKQNSRAYQALQYDIEQAQIRLQDAKNDMQWYLDSMESSGEGPFSGADTAQFDAYSDKLRELENATDSLSSRLSLLKHSFASVASSLAKTAWTAVVAGLRAIGASAGETAQNLTKLTATAVSSGIRRLGGWLSNAAKSMTLFGRSAKRNNGVLKKSFSTILKYGLGVRSFYFPFRKIRQAIGEGYQNLARYSDTLNASISGVISSFKRFENQFAASFAPLVNAVAPAIAQLIDGLTEATFRAGQFIAALSGQKTVIRAKEVQEDFAASLEETKKAAKDAKNQLAGFDKLEILKEKDEHTDPNDMFETVPVEDEAKQFADDFKDAWVHVDLSGIGKIIGGKIKAALDNIPWPGIKKGAENTGKRLATFLTGLIGVPDLGKSLGKAIAEAINAAFAFLDGFAWNFDWKGLGNAIMDAVEAACDNLDWALINRALQGLAIGLSDLLNTIFSRKEVWEKVGQTIGRGINAAVLFGLTFLERFDFQQAASAIVAGLNAAVAAIRFDNIGQLLGSLLGGALQFLYTAVTEFSWEKLGNQIAVGVNAFTSTVRRKIYDINWADMGAAIADGFNTAIVGIEWGGVGETVGMLFGGALTAVASFIRGLDYGEIVQAIQDFFSGALQQIDFYDLLTVWGVAALIVAVKKIIATHPVLALLVGAVLALGPELGNAIHKMVEDIPWEEVGATVGGAFLGALSRINDAIESVNWVEIGEAVGRFLGSINWKEIIGEVFELALNLIAAGFEMIVGFLRGLGAANIR